MYNDYNDLKSIDEVIAEVKKYGTGSWIWDGTEIREDVFMANIFPILEDLKDYEIDMDEETFNYILENGTGGNTYNVGANISNDIDFSYVENLGAILKIHLGGDIRANYSYYFAIESIDELYECESIYQYKDIDDRYTADIDAFSEGISIYDTVNGEDVGECYEIEKDYVLKWIEDNVNEYED